MRRHKNPARLSRRDFLKTLGLGAGAAMLSGCAPDLFLPPAYPTWTASPTLTPFQPSLPTASPTLTRRPSATPPPTDLPTGTPTQWTWSLSTPTPNLTETRLPADEDGRFLCFVLWDHQLKRYNYKPRNPKVPLPETCPLLSGVANRLTPEWEAYWRGILWVCNPGMGEGAFEAAWKGLVADARAFTNNKGLDSGNFALWSITCGGATHEVVSGEPEGPGGKYTRIYTLNHSKGPPPIPSKPKEIDITRHFMATTGSSKRASDGTYAVYGFPQFENSIVPLISPEDTDMIETERIKFVDKVQRPYNT